MENIEEIKNMWTELNSRITCLEDDHRRIAREVTQSKFKTAREKLVAKYKAFIFIALIMIIYMNLYLIHMPDVVEQFRIPAIIYWTCFFLFTAGADTYLMLKVKDIDVYNSSVRDISRQASHNWKMHKIVLIIGLPLAFGAIFLLSLLLNARENIYIIYGIITGGVVGLVIGIIHLLKFREYYKLLQTEN